MKLHIIYLPENNDPLPSISREDWYACNNGRFHIAGSETLASELATKWASDTGRRAYVFVPILVAIPPKPQPASIERMDDGKSSR